MKRFPPRLLARVENTIRTYSDYVRYGEYWKAVLKGKTLRQVIPADIERYVAKRIEQVKPASVNCELRFLNHVFNVAIADGLADTNPVRAVKLFKENNQRIRYLTADEEVRLRKKIGEANWVLVALAVHTGLRESEQFRLEWEHVDFRTGIITVPRSKHGEKRHVPMNATVRELLLSLPSRGQSTFVFPSATGETPLDACNFMNRVFRKALIAAEIEDLRWHDLRHNADLRIMPSHCIDHLCRRGVPSSPAVLKSA